jgi:hypothetical protein
MGERLVGAAGVTAGIAMRRHAGSALPDEDSAVGEV